MESVEAFEIEGQVVWLLTNDYDRRFVCTCSDFHTPTPHAPYGSCRHVIIVSSQLAGHPVELRPPTSTATVLEFRRR